MKKTIFTTSILVAGFVLGASALTVLAQAAWTSPGSTPPTCVTSPVTNPAYREGCNPPINSGASDQFKTGLLTLANFIFNHTGVANVVPGQVLTAKDTLGTVEWQTPSGGFDFSGAGTEYDVQIYANGNYTYLTISPTTAKGVVFNLNKGDLQCDDMRIELFKGRLGGAQPFTYLGYVFGATTDGTIRQTGDVITMPVTNGQVVFKNYGSSGGTCLLKAIKIADIY